MDKITTYLLEEKQAKRKGGLYHKTQVSLTYNSNRIEGSRLTEEQTRYIFETHVPLVLRMKCLCHDVVPVNSFIIGT